MLYCSGFPTRHLPLCKKESTETVLRHKLLSKEEDLLKGGKNKVQKNQFRMFLVDCKKNKNKNVVSLEKNVKKHRCSANTSRMGSRGKHEKISLPIEKLT
ncbi:hypothetical protein CEXT_634921 [Caerostris extrusa]|uniref:Uncharacterized protein n=1 Tax=Caerostris extrusa TaxID=172846 RepID=A0AAV4WH37_CAEEX|nr:hypothetical protein CEXT_634921 [Caerostris extrusa]